MPTYDYQCQSCRHEFTVTHKIADPAPRCPQCGGEVRKKLSAPAIGKSAAAPSFSGGGCGSGACGHKH
ncbi:MAG: zinc ribbon domain-containing protein [Methylococcaceae bacterium]|nr:zinc ribbon domain-containing protein [Methylococcaceae bacterium]